MNKECLLGVDIGGSHISSALIDKTSGLLLAGSIRKNMIDANGDSVQIINDWASTMKASLSSLPGYRLGGIGVAVPGPFDYQHGISLMKGVNKYASLFGISIREELKKQLLLQDDFPLVFENDAACFGIGEVLDNGVSKYSNVVAITLGTGFGSTFLRNGIVIKHGDTVPPNGEIYNSPYLGGINEDYISGKWILSTYNAHAPVNAASVRIIAERAISHGDEEALNVFNSFGFHLARCLTPWLQRFQAECIVIGGSIAKSAQLFLDSLKTELHSSGLFIPIKISEHMEVSAIKGAAHLINKEIKESPAQPYWRKSNQPLLPIHHEPTEKETGQYDMYPTFPLGTGKIFNGYESLADWILTKKSVAIDGISGNDWSIICQSLDKLFKQRNVTVQWHEMKSFQKPEATIEEITKPFISNPGDVWGTRATISLADFFDVDALPRPTQTGTNEIQLLIGTGAALAGWEHLIYFDVPKNEIQFRMRAGQPVSMVPINGSTNPDIYKRLYFVDWVVSNKHRAAIQDKIAIIADGQWLDTITWATAGSIYDGFRKMAKSVFRARPWFEPGAWGGQWLKNKIKGISQAEVNYAWSFELIVPENGVVFESDTLHLEVAFDWLMQQEAATILGADHATFGTEFPIRFDYLDTMDGGNLSIQCHPSLSYIKKEFGENITQDETYYILDCKEDAQVYLGFQESIDPGLFKTELQESVDNNVPVDITKHIQTHSAHKHDLFLIPNQTVHSAGKNNLVLEISATPYIFTFKMYDWLRLDLEGNPRPINIDHAFRNLDFSRKGARVKEELISKPTVLEKKNDYTLFHLPTHTEHFYDVHRLEFLHAVEIETNDKCFVMMVVEGKSVLVTGEGFEPARFSYAETFIVPAGVRKLLLTNESGTVIKIVKAFVK